ncbi:MAG: hypothetical protein ABI889_01740 [Gemmatimonadota bacterium]
MTVTNGMRDESIVRYDDRQPVHGRALLPAIAAGLGAGLAVFYLARLLAERAPLLADEAEATPRNAVSARTRG